MPVAVEELAQDPGLVVPHGRAAAGGGRRVVAVAGDDAHRGGGGPHGRGERPHRVQLEALDGRSCSRAW